jgi:DNA-binding NtrC family response regulator
LSRGGACAAAAHPPQDIPALANFFVREVYAVRQVPPRTLSRATLSLISAPPCRGNAIELRAKR